MVAARRDIRRAMGEAGIQALENAVTEAEKVRAEMVGLNRQQQKVITQIQKDLKQTVDAVSLLANAYQLRIERDMRIQRSLWTRLRFLLRGTHDEAPRAE